MSNEETMLTSEITALLRHKSTAATRSWIRNHQLEAIGRDRDSGEKLYSRAMVERAIAEMPRGPYEKSRPPAGETSHDHAVLPDGD